MSIQSTNENCCFDIDPDSFLLSLISSGLQIFLSNKNNKKNQKKYLHRKRLIRLPEIETNLFLEVCNRNLPLLIFVNKFSFFPGSGFLETDNVDPNNTDQNNAETSNVKINEKHFKY